MSVGIEALQNRHLKYLGRSYDADHAREAIGRAKNRALSVDLTEQMQIAGWLYWRIYETRLARKTFHGRFGNELDDLYGKSLRTLKRMRLFRDDGENIVLTDRGSYWLHDLEDLFSNEYVGKLWSTSVAEPWPQEVVL